MTEAYYSLATGSDLANLKNIEDTVGAPIHELFPGRIPHLGNIGRRVLSGAWRQDGALLWPFRIGALTETQRNDFMFTYFGELNIASVAIVFSGIDEAGFYAPFTADLKKMRSAENYQLLRAGYSIENDLIMRLVLVSTTLTGATAITSSARLHKGDTSGAGFTTTLPAANSANANTVFSFWKIAAANTWTISRAGADTLDGGTTITLTADHERKDLISDGVSAWTTIKTYAGI